MQFSKMATGQEGDVLLENPAWKVAREALQTIDGHPKQERKDQPPQEPKNEPFYNQSGAFMPQDRPTQYNYNYYPQQSFGGYNQRYFIFSCIHKFNWLKILHDQMKPVPTMSYFCD